MHYQIPVLIFAVIGFVQVMRVALDLPRKR